MNRRFAFLDVAVDFVEETGQPLDLVHEHPTAGRDRAQLGGESSRVGQIALIQGLVEKTANEDGWRHLTIVLEPLNPDYEPIELTAEDESPVEVVAELIEVLGTEPPTDELGHP